MKRLDVGKRNEEEEKVEEVEKVKEVEEEEDDDDENERRRYATALGFGRKTPKLSTAIIVLFAVSTVASF